ncbi:MAG TPA: N-acetylmuramoyl-L-alanine amidase [Thermodesulfobacteriota bacterium]
MGKYLSVLIISFMFLLCPDQGACSLRDLPVAEDGIRIIVIDPGHGGDDTGAKGPAGSEEKDVTLKLAWKLAEVLKERLDVRVLLTRTADVFIPLEERTAFANRMHADLFISIHANAAQSREAKGIETFFLNFEATDEDARRVAAFENSANAAGLMDVSPAEGGDLKDILVDLANTMSHHESSRLAEVVHASMLGAAGRESRGVKQAHFTVLVGATMPAVLVEVGFITNPAEERLLTSAKDQARMAEAIADGILNFRDIVTRKRGYIEISGKSEED